MITLKEIAPYLPYKLNILYHSRKVKMNAGTGSSTNWIGITALLQRQGEKCKPILRPLSDLTKEIEFEGEKIIPYKELKKDFLMEGLLEFKTTVYGWTGFTDNKNNHIPIYMDGKIMPECGFGTIQKLFEWHFDVFGLIERGNAIDINTLK